jgi:hypothetical protein
MKLAFKTLAALMSTAAALLFAVDAWIQFAAGQTGLGFLCIAVCVIWTYHMFDDWRRWRAFRRELGQRGTM